MIRLENGKLIRLEVLREKTEYIPISKNEIVNTTNDDKITFHKNGEVTVKHQMSSRKEKLYRLGNNIILPAEYLGLQEFEKAKKLYIKLKEKKNRFASEGHINILGSSFLSANEVKTAMFIWQMNVEFYPNSANTYDSLTEGYEKNNQLKLALINFKKAVELGEANKDKWLYLFKINLKRIEKKYKDSLNI